MCLLFLSLSCYDLECLRSQLLRRDQNVISEIDLGVIFLFVVVREFVYRFSVVLGYYITICVSLSKAYIQFYKTNSVQSSLRLLPPFLFLQAGLGLSLARVWCYHFSP